MIPPCSRSGLPRLFRRTQTFNQGSDILNSPSRNPGSKPHRRWETPGTDTHPPSAFFYWDERWNWGVCLGIAEDLGDAEETGFRYSLHVDAPKKAVKSRHGDSSLHRNLDETKTQAKFCRRVLYSLPPHCSECLPHIVDSHGKGRIINGHGGHTSHATHHCWGQRDFPAISKYFSERSDICGSLTVLPRL